MKTRFRNKVSGQVCNLEIQAVKSVQGKVKKASTPTVRLDSVSNTERSDRQKVKKPQQDKVTT